MGAVPERICVGLSCVVMFGGRAVIGYVVDVFDDVPEDCDFEIQQVERFIDGPYFSQEAPVLAQWISEEYGSSLAESLRLFIPPQGKFLLESDGEALNVTQNGPRPKYETYYMLTESGKTFVPSARAKKMLEVLDILKAGEVSRAALEARIGSCAPQVARLKELGVVSERKERIYRGDIAFDAASYKRPDELHDEQQRAVTAILEACKNHLPETFVLDGVTGSGKTEVYLRVIEQVVGSKKTALVLVPEISLTPQTVGRFQSRFKGRVAVLHSRLTEAERQDQWERIRQGGADVVVGARSALFAPLLNLGIIVIDEEHDSSYKQGSSPRYHARDVAIQRAHQAKIPVVLGSATPSFEALHRCREGEWRLLPLTHRANERPVPVGEIVDLTKEFEQGNRSMFSRRLQESLSQVIERREKAMLLLNRRGSASFLLCRECGYVPQCPDCSTSLTYHEHNNHLRCHQCNRIEVLPAQCPECGSPYLQQFNAGTQRLEAAFKALYPDVPVVRMDADTTAGRRGHQEVLDEFAAFDYGVLIGTQMIAKGLDFPEVTLVGVVTADTILNLPDYSAAERTYQLLEQVAGRAGRGSKPGEVIIQTYWPEHRSIQAAAQHMRSIFYDAEVQERKELHNPPFVRLANIIVSSPQSSEALEQSKLFVERINEAHPEYEVLGPAPCVLARIHKKFRYHVLIKAPRGTALGTHLNALAKKMPHKKDVSLAIDVDPQSLM